MKGDYLSIQVPIWGPPVVYRWCLICPCTSWCLFQYHPCLSSLSLNDAYIISLYNQKKGAIAEIFLDLKFETGGRGEIRVVSAISTFKLWEIIIEKSSLLFFIFPSTSKNKWPCFKSVSLPSFLGGPDKGQTYLVSSVLEAHQGKSRDQVPRWNV